MANIYCINLKLIFFLSIIFLMLVTSCGPGAIKDTTISNEQYNSMIIRRTLDLCINQENNRENKFQTTDCQEILTNPLKYNLERDIYKFSEIHGFRLLSNSKPGEIIQIESIQSRPTLFMDKNGLLNPPNKIGKDQEVLVLYDKRFITLKEMYEIDPTFFKDTKLDKTLYTY